MSISLVSRVNRKRILAGDMPAWIAKHRWRRYIIRAILSCPDWVDRKELRKIELAAQEKTKATGVKHVSDHRIPLSHPRVCGLTVPWNMHVITHAQNQAKSNHWCPEQMDFFNADET